MCRKVKGEFSIIAAMLVAVILVGTVIATYSIIRNLSLTHPPNVLSSTLEMNLSLKHTLEFISGYYSSILQVTGNTTYARSLVSNYLYSALLNIAFSHPDWNPSFEVNYFNVSNVWFERVSYSQAEITITYNLSGMGTYGIRYAASSLLNVTILDSDANQSRVLVKREENMPDLTLGLENFFFYQYDYSSSTWNLVHPDVSPIAFSNGTYILQIPCGVDFTAYMVKVVDQRGMMATAFFSQSKRPQYTYTFNWDSKYNSLKDDTIAVEVLQNGTLRWLDQILVQGKPIPPISVKAFHVSVNANSTNLEEKQVPFQIEDWESNYTVPLGLSSNTTIFSNRNMIVFLINHKVENVTLWWDGRDTITQTPLAYTNKYFTQDDTTNGILTNGKLKLIIPKIYLYVDNFNTTNNAWTDIGTSPYLNDDEANYIYTKTRDAKEGWFTFQDIPLAYRQSFVSIDQWVGGSVSVEFECKRSDDDDYFEFNINDGTTTYGPYEIKPEKDNYEWKPYDISNIINTTKQINNATIEVIYRKGGWSASNIYIRRCRLTIDFWLTATTGNSTTKADFLRINSEYPVYGAGATYVIHHGIIRDIVQQEAEWSGGVENCSNVYSHIVLTLPANATYYTYALRLIFVNSSQSRTITDLSAIRLSVSGSLLSRTENGTSGGYPISWNTTGIFYNFTSANFSTGWAHHWSELTSGSTGAGIMFINSSNFKLYGFDDRKEFNTEGKKTGALNVSANFIEFSPIALEQVSFNGKLDITWCGAVVTFASGHDPIYKSSDSIGLWVVVEYPPTVEIG